ncbi:MAG: T9SS type A sorting domain-containing protein [Bacteroidota bacterium]|nr:T9SS type A sorting domain-containing protein [Bacteroidota bacterium]
MNRDQHQSEIEQIKKHVKMLNITGSIAIGALAIAGVLMVTDTFEAVSESAPSGIVVKAADQEIPVVGEMLNTLEEPATSLIPQAAKETENQANKSNSTGKSKAVVPKTVSFTEELQSFEASCNDGALFFQWVTSGGTKYAYEIEKTYDQVTYEVFSRAPQPDKKDGKNIYSVEESTAKGDEAFYRLRKVIGKGKYEYSEAVKVKCSGMDARSATVDVFPNGNGSFRIVINSGVAGPYKVTLSDVNETELATEEFQAIEGNNEFILSSNSITRGNYVLRVSNDAMVKEKKVVLK